MGRRWPALCSLLGLLAGLGTLRVPSSDPAAQPEGVVGLVRDAHGPVAGARVRCKGRPEAVLTDAAGRFCLPGRFPARSRLTAWREGNLIAGVPIDSVPLALRLEPLPASDADSYAWVDPRPGHGGSQSCGKCHEEIYQEWNASSHARAATGHFLDLYAGSLLDERPDASGVCAACHAPTASLQAALDLREARGVDQLGVHCDFCHKVADADLGGLGTTHGRYALKLLRPAEGQLFFGPLDDVDRGEDADAPIYRESRYCASCHEGTVLGVHVYGTYSEWLKSPARQEGKQCQTCHMTPTGRLTNFAPEHGGIERDPRTLANHRFFNGSQEEMLRRCLHVDVSARREEVVRVQVEARADGVGHRVPTGFIDRHLVLLVEGIAADGRTVRAVAGPVLPGAAGRELSGQAGKVYGRLLRDEQGHEAAPFWRDVREIADTRLSPGDVDRSRYAWPASVRRVRVRVLYRRFWEVEAERNGWADNEVLVLEQVVEAPRKEGGE